MHCFRAQKATFKRIAFPSSNRQAFLSIISFWRCSSYTRFVMKRTFRHLHELKRTIYSCIVSGVEKQRLKEKHFQVAIDLGICFDHRFCRCSSYMRFIMKRTFRHLHELKSTVYSCIVSGLEKQCLTEKHLQIQIKLGISFNHRFCRCSSYMSFVMKRTFRHSHELKSSVYSCIVSGLEKQRLNE